MKKIIILIFVLSLTGCAFLGIHVVRDHFTAAEHNDLGYAYEAGNKLDLAEKEYKKAIKKDKKWHLPYFNLGNVYYKTARPETAEKYYRTGLKYSPLNPDIMNNLALALSEQGKHSQAMKWIEKALEVDSRPEYVDSLNQILLKISP